MQVTKRPLLSRNLLFILIALVVPLAAATQALTPADLKFPAAPVAVVLSAPQAATAVSQPSTGEILPPIFAGVPVESPDTAFLVRTQPEAAAAPDTAATAAASEPLSEIAPPIAPSEPPTPEPGQNVDATPAGWPNGAAVPAAANTPAGPQMGDGAAFSGPSRDGAAGGLSTTAVASPRASVAASGSVPWGRQAANGVATGSATSTRRTAGSSARPAQTTASVPSGTGSGAASAAAGVPPAVPPAVTGANEGSPAAPPSDAPAATAPTAVSPGTDVPQAVAPVAAEPPVDNPSVVGPVIVSPSPGPVLYAGTQLRVLQWNLHHGVGTDGVYNIDRLATWMAAMKPDVVMLNEVERNDYWGNEDQPARYEAMLEAKTGREWYGVFFQEFGDWTAAGKGHLILSTFPIQSTDKTVISYSRVIGAARIVVNGRTISLLSTHLDPDSVASRLTQAQEVTRWATGQPENRILTGDMNAWPDQTSIGALNVTYNDSWTVAVAKGMATSFAGLNPVGATKNGRIDYILFSKGAGNLDVLDSRVVDTRDSAGVMPSDHRPVVTTFQVQ